MEKCPRISGRFKIKKMFTRKNINVIAPFEREVNKKSTLFTARYKVLNKNLVVGTITEKAALTIKREISIDLPTSISPPIQVFLLFLVCNHAYRYHFAYSLEIIQSSH